MTYYKIISNSSIIGVSTSNDCLRFLAKHAMLQKTLVNLAEYIECGTKLYHATWMAPIKTNIYPYEIAEVISIEEQEYNALAPQVDENPIPIEEDELEEIIPAPIDPVEELTIEYLKEKKINEMSYSCRTTIEQGFDLEIQGETHHFSLTTQDQLNLMSLEVMARTENLIPYHADGETTVFFTAAEINLIVSAATLLKIYNTTYFNALKAYINALETIEEISAITYGTPIPEEYQSDVYKVITE